MKKCPTCNTEMKPLATGVYCPNDCDRVAIIEESKMGPVYVVKCPGCKSENVAMFDLFASDEDDDFHCWDCGKVFK